MKNKKIIQILVLSGLSLLFFSHCKSVKVISYVKDKKEIEKINTIAMGYIEIRNIEVSPYVRENFYNSILFELEKKGYKVISWNELQNSMNLSQIENNQYLTYEEIYRLTKTSSFDIFIQGYIQENVIEDSIYLEPHSTIVLFLHSRKNGKKIGEIRLFSRDKTIQSSENLHYLTEKAVKELIKNLE